MNPAGAFARLAREAAVDAAPLKPQEIAAGLGTRSAHERGCVVHFHAALRSATHTGHDGNFTCCERRNSTKYVYVDVTRPQESQC